MTLIVVDAKLREWKTLFFAIKICTSRISVIFSPVSALNGINERFFVPLTLTADSEIVFIHRLPLTNTELGIIRFVNKRVVFDFDDAIVTDMDLQYANEDIKNTISRSSLLIAGNNYLSESVKTFNDNIVTIPTCVDTYLYKPDSKNKDSSVITIGWIGLSANLRYLSVVSDALREVSANNKSVVLKIVSDAYIDIPGVEVVKKRWSLDEGE